MFGEKEPVGAGDRNACILERPDNRLEQGAALAHQDQHIAGARSLRNPALHVTGDLGCQPNLRARLALFIEWRPRINRAFLLRFDGVPQLDKARRGVRERDMRRDTVIIGRDAAINLRACEDLIHGAEHVAPERNECLKSR